MHALTCPWVCRHMTSVKGQRETRAALNRIEIENREAPRMRRTMRNWAWNNYAAEPARRLVYQNIVAQLRQ